MKFISFRKNPHIAVFDKHLDIEFNNNLNAVKNSNKALIMWNYFAHKELFDYFKQNNKKTYCVERGALPGTVFIDSGGFNCMSDSYHEKNWNHKLIDVKLNVTEKYIKEFTETNSALEPQESNRVSKDIFIDNIGGKKFNKIIFIPLQLNRDTVIKHFGDWIKDVHYFLKQIEILANDNKDYLFLIKNHPLETYDIKTKDNIKVVDNFHFKDCIEYSNYVITINSGIGLQTMLFNTPCIVCGKSFYQFEDVNYKADNIDDINNFIRKDLIIDFDKAKRFISFLINDFYCHVKMVKPKPKLNRMNIKEIYKVITYG
jgi:hypothetical protein